MIDELEGGRGGTSSSMIKRAPPAVLPKPAECCRNLWRDTGVCAYTFSFFERAFGGGLPALLKNMGEW